MVVRTFIHRQILPLREREHLLWQHQGRTDLMMEFPYPISEGLFRVLRIRAIDVEYPGEGAGPPSFNTEHPPPTGHRFTGMVSEPPIPPSQVD